MTASNWSDVPARVAELSVDPDAATDIGTEAQEWDLEPPLSAEELAELEGQLRVGLPHEYRSFLLEVGRGGAGPAYGLFPLRRVNGRWCWEGDGADLTDPATMDQPFPYTDAVNPADGLPEAPARAEFGSTGAFDQAMHTYMEQRDAAVYAPEHSTGFIYLCHLGCAIREGLVVSGPARGQMWSDDRASDRGFAPLRDDDGSPLGFARWYRRWLEFG